MHKRNRKPPCRKIVLRLPDLDHTKSAVLNSLSSPCSRRNYRPTTKDSQFFILEYNVTVDMPKYVGYTQGYVVPQFEAWAKAGVLSSYACYTNQNPAGAPWSSFIVLEYKDLKSLAARETIKNKVRAELAASNPTWKKWSEDKTAIRQEKAAIPALSLK